MATPRTMLACLLAWLPAAWAMSGESGAAADIAPKVEGTRIQTWPAAAWSGKANCWLVVWVEGDVTEEKTEIWCARVGADGKTLDPQGIRVCGGKDLGDRPSVTSGGEDFLVVWEDLRSGKDWDIYAARVSGDGKVLDPDGVVVAGGEHNQCRPAAVFCQGIYVVAFMAYTAKGEGEAGTPGTGYVARSVRVSMQGKPIDGAPPAVSDPEPKLHLWQPCAAAGEDGVLIGAYQRNFGEDYKPVFLSAGWMAMPDGKPGTPMGMVVSSAPAPYKNLPAGSRTQHQPPAATWTGKEYLLATPRGAAKTNRAPDSVAVFHLDARGRDLGNPEIVDVFGGNRMHMQNPRVSLAFDGERVLLIQDQVVAMGARGKELARMQVRGCFLSPEGKPLDTKSVLVAGDEELKKDYMQGFAAAGPKGKFLAVWSEARGVDDVKIAGRVIK